MFFSFLGLVYLATQTRTRSVQKAMLLTLLDWMAILQRPADRLVNVSHMTYSQALELVITSNC